MGLPISVDNDYLVLLLWVLVTTVILRPLKRFCNEGLGPSGHPQVTY